VIAARLAGFLGRLLIGAGLLVLAFASFQVFGTSFIQQQHQQTLRTELHKVLGPTVTPPASSKPVVAPATAAPQIAAPVAEIQIPSIGLDQIVVEGTGEAQLELGPGHYVGTPLPGQAGNVGIAGHRTTWGHPFYNLDGVKVGDPIILRTPQGSFTYTMTRLFVVDPSDVAVLNSTAVPSLTLTTCNPRYSAATRLIARAVLSASSLTPHPQALPVVRSSSRARTAASSHSALPAVLWGALLVFLGLITWIPARRSARPWFVYVLGLIPFSMALVGFFVALNPLLPANY